MLIGIDFFVFKYPVKLKITNFKILVIFLKFSKRLTFMCSRTNDKYNLLYWKN